MGTVTGTGTAIGMAEGDTVAGTIKQTARRMMV